MEEMDFPPSPVLGQTFTNSVGVTYQWNGASWVVAFSDGVSGDITKVLGLLNQVRILLQDTDLTSGSYRYSTNSLIMNLNQAMMDLYRMRPDLFLASGFVLPQFTIGELDVLVPIEAQYIPPVIYYIVGLTQARDDEQNQDARAFGFLKVFQQTVISGGLA